MSLCRSSCKGAGRFCPNMNTTTFETTEYSYKQACEKRFRKKKCAKSYGEIKMQKHIDRIIREDIKEHQQKPKKTKKIIDAEMQMFSGFAEERKMIKDTTMNANKLIENLNCQLAATMGNFHRVFDKCEKAFFNGISLLDVCTDVISTLCQVSFAKPGYKIASLAIEVFRLIKKYVTKIDFSLDKIKELLTYIPQFSRSAKVIDAQMQLDVSDFLDQTQLSYLIQPSVIVSGLFLILSVIFTSALPKKTDMEDMLKRIGDLGRNSKGIMDLNNTMTIAVTKMMDHFGVNTLGLKQEAELANSVSGYKEWCDSVRNLVGHKIMLDGTLDSKSIVENIMKDVHEILRVENMYKKGMEIARDISDLRLPSKITLSFNTHMRYLTEVYKSVDTSGAFGNKPRTQPVVIWLYGESGVGKSGMSWPLAVDLNNSLVETVEEARNFSKNIYMRNVEQEFWDNYQGQNIVVYDDFGQMRDSSSNPNMEFMELIRTANIAPYPLHMAHLEDKRKAKFTSKVILMTSNVFEQTVNSLTFPDAFKRRVDLCGEVKNRDEFTKTGFSSTLGKEVQRLDRTKVQKITGDLISTEPYLIDLVNPETGEKYQEDLTYEEFLDLALEKTEMCRQQSAGMNDFLMSYAEKRMNTKRHVSDKAPEMEFEDAMSEPLDVSMQAAIKDLSYVEIPKEVAIRMIESCEKAAIFMGEQYKQVCSSTIAWTEGLCDYDEIVAYVEQNTFYQKIERGTQMLNKVLNKSLDFCKEWINKTVEYAKEHPWTTVVAVLGTLIGILSIVGFWKWLVGSSKKPTKRHFINHNGRVLIIPLRTDKNCGWELENHLDCSMMNVEYVEEHILLLLKDQNVVIVPKVTRAILCALDAHASQTDKVICVTKNRHLNYKREHVVLVDGELNDFSVNNVEMEAQSSSDAVTLKQQHKKMVEAFSSADNRTLKQQKPKVVEAVSSADCVTLKQRAPLILEAAVSADCVTKSLQKVRHVEAFSSADNVTLKKQVSKFVESEGIDTVDCDMQMWRDQVAQKLITNRILTNLYKICLVREDGRVTPLTNGLFIRANVMLIPGHLLGFIDSTDTIEIRNLFDVVFRVPFADVKVVRIENAIGEEKEAALLSFPKYVCSHSDIVKHFQNAQSMSGFKRCEVTLPVLRYSEKLKALMSTLIECDKVEAYDTEVQLRDKNLGIYVLRRGLEYTMPTMAGDCGAPLIINETQVLRKIAGIHVAGDAGGKAYAESITQADLTRALSNIDVTMQIQLDLDFTLDFSKDEAPIESGVEFGPEDVRDFCDLPALKMLPVGKIPTPLFEPGKTEVRPSLVYGRIAKLTTKPAYLKNMYVDNKFVNLKHLNLKKCAMDTPYIPKDLIEEAYALTKQVWLKGMRPELRQKLTYEEAIIGSDKSEFISSINRSSSPGYPWIQDRTKGTKGKQGWFGTDGDYILNKEVETAVMNRLNQAALGKRMPVMWVDTLKDERRPIAKVEQLKTRVFSNGPMDFSIAFRMMYLPFIAHLMENRITNEVSIGTNVYSQDWAKTVQKLSKHGEKIIAGDFSTFDGSLNTCIMEKFADLANEFFDDGPENALIRHVLLQDVYNSVHICNDSVYMMTHSQPSGNPATTPLNCFINSMGLRMCFDICNKEAVVKNQSRRMLMKEFNKHVSMVSYGDDNVINFSDEVAEWYNMETIAEAFKTLGFTYTDELKGANGVVPKYRTIKDVQYLKRGFRFDSKRKVWEAPLSMDTILEMPNWCRGGLDIQEGTKLNCENAIMELSMHSSETFEHWSKVINKAYVQATGDVLDINTYKGYSQERYLQYYMG